MNHSMQRIVSVSLGVLLLMSTFLPLYNSGRGSDSISLVDGLDGFLNGNSIVIVAFAVLNLFAAAAKKYDYMRTLSVGILAVTLSLMLDMVSIGAFKHVQIGLFGLFLFSVIGALGVEKIKLS